MQSVLTYCIPIWGGAAKTRMIEVERAQRALLKVMLFKKRRFPTSILYTIINVLSVRKLYVLNSILKKHKTLTYDGSLHQKRRKQITTNIKTNTAFADRQYTKQSDFLYKKINKNIEIYSKTS